jgi:hypothetical protein
VSQSIRPYDFILTFVLLSWTVITWLVVIGSSLIMVIWVVIYSFFETPDFNNEAIILFGGITFWATVLVSVTLALSMSALSHSELF